MGVKERQERDKEEMRRSILEESAAQEAAVDLPSMPGFLARDHPKPNT